MKIRPQKKCALYSKKLRNVYSNSAIVFPMSVLLSQLVGRPSADPQDLDATFFPRRRGLPSERVPNLDSWKDSKGFLSKPTLRWNRVHGRTACFRPCRPEGPRIELEDLNLGDQGRHILHILLEPQELPYAFYHMNGYGIPRADCTVVGGTYEENESNLNPPEGESTG